MTVTSRFVRYSFTCPSGHTEIREEMISKNELEAGREVKRRTLTCGFCKANSLTSKFLIRILINEPIIRRSNA